MKKITLVLGLGISGLAAAEFLLTQKKIVLGIDSSVSLLQKSPELCRLQSLGLFIQSDLEEIDFSRVEQLIVSPGISPKHPIYQGALESGVPILGEAELALSHFKSVYLASGRPIPRLLAVTGTNGKTTVTLLTAHLLNHVGIKARAVGNVGSALCKCLLEPSDDEVFVIELSSYQLETMRSKLFDAAVLLNITPDHLDRYDSIDAYARAKCHLQSLLKEGAPFFVQEEVLLDFGHLLRDRENIECLSPLNYRERNKHDVENERAARSLCRLFCIPEEQFLRGLETFKKPPHRIEFVKEIDGVHFYDDSKGTNLDAAVQAVNSMKGPVILIAGGVDKGASYLFWKNPFLGKVKKIIAIGEAAPKMYRELHPYFNVKLADTLALAVSAAREESECGDCVLLSPGCASFDMFRDYAHRGEEFQKYVNSIEERRES